MVSVSEQVIEYLNDRKNFIVEAGAGSGKTYTLVEVLSSLIQERSKQLLASGQQIVCITYTNVAADEIKSRINNDPLVRVSTIHSFLWSVIEPYQTELRVCLQAMNSGREENRRIADLDLTNKEIKYVQYGAKWQEGEIHIHHDDVINLSSRMFATYKKLSYIVYDRFPVIFVDEYQDTQEKVVKILLDNLGADVTRRSIIGFFGDYMQQIYNSGIGKKIYNYNKSLKQIQIHENYRCTREVIEVLNKLRPKLRQVTAKKKPSAGSARFFYSSLDDYTAIQQMQEKLASEGWGQDDEKVLMLTRRSIAKSQGWNDLMDAYKKKGKYAIDDLIRRDDEFGETFEYMESLAEAFNSRRSGNLFRLLENSFQGPKKNIVIDTHGKKKDLHSSLRELISLRENKSVGDVLDFAWEHQIVSKDNRITKLEEQAKHEADLERKNRYSAFLNAVWAVPYRQVIKLNRYLDKMTPFSTQHGVKGEEYDNVLVVIDDSTWNQYNFSSVFEGNDKESQYARSLNLLYVCCSRAKRNLVVLMLSPMTNKALDGAKRLFGSEYVTDLDKELIQYA